MENKQTAATVAKELGASNPADHGINWTWSIGFKRKEVAEQFVAWLETHDYEHRGIYGPDPHGHYDVRWRK